MSAARAGVRPAGRTILRRRLSAIALLAAATVALVAVIAGRGGSDLSGGSSSPAVVRLELGGRELASARVSALSRPRAQAALVASLPAQRTLHRDGATIRLRVDRSRAEAAIANVTRSGGGTVTVPEHPVAASIAVPVVKQALQNNCETASLAMLLSFRGRRTDQLTLQRRIAHSPPLDPTVAGDGSEVWGDPSRGFVGRADGGGPAGGFGVYQGPVEALAAREGVKLRDLTGASPAAVYRALLGGHPVMAWVALAPGPYATWQTPSGRIVHVNWGEHALVLSGVGPDQVRVNEPLEGTRVTWSKEEFESMWRALGSRALAA